jgi:pentatricopeptide repeat protein
VLVSGEAGIGKTSLGQELVAESREQGALVLAGACYDLTTTPPYGPWVELARRSDPEGDLPAVPRFVHDQEAPAALQSQAELFEQAMAFFVDAAARRPLVLVLEDLHWSDQASLDLLRYLARKLEDYRILIIATYRDDEVMRQHPLFGLMPALIRESHATRIELSTLDRDDVRTLVRNRWELSADDEQRLLAYLLSHAEGHPLFTEEVLRTLEQNELIRFGGDHWTIADLRDVPVPTLVRQVIEGRVAQLSEDVRLALGVAAVIGYRVPLDVWQNVTEMTDEELLTVLDQSISLHLLEESSEANSVSFVHALTREALYRDILSPRRRIWHRLIGESLANASSPPLDAVAFHFQQAGDERAVEWLVRAGDQAAHAFAALTAIERYEAALTILKAQDGRPDEQGWLLLKIGIESRGFGSRASLDWLEEARTIAEATGNKALEASVLFQIGVNLLFLGEGGLVEVEQGIRARAALSPEDRGILEAHFPGSDTRLDDTSLAIMLALYGHYREAIALATKSLAQSAPRSAFRMNERGHSWAALAHSHCALGRPDDAAQAFQQMHADYRTARNDWYRALNSTFEFVHIVMAYYPTDARKRKLKTRELRELWTRISGIATSLPPTFGLLPVMLHDGAWTEALSVGLSHTEQDAIYRYFALLPVGNIARYQGEFDLAWEQVRAGLPHGPDTEPGKMWFIASVELQRLAAELALDQQDVKFARRWLQTHDEWVEWSGAKLGRAEGHLLWAQLHLAEGDHERAREVADRALEQASDPEQPLALMAIHRFQGELFTRTGDLDTAAYHLKQSLTLAQACAVPFELALTLLSLAELRISAGEMTEAEKLLNEVRAICVPLDAKPTLARVEALAARLRSGSKQANYPSGLTRREVEVLRLLAQGLSDREIGEALFISRHTVMRHVSHILAKLDVDSRTAAAAHAVRNRIV